MTPLKLVVLVLSLVVLTEALPDGAPAIAQICESMIPGHGVGPQKSEPPYQLSVENIGDDELVFTLEPKKPDYHFKGFMLQVRDNNGKPVGRFQHEIEGKPMSCPPGQNNALTHTSDIEKLQIKATWRNSDKIKGPVYGIATFAHEKNEFWVGLKTAPINL